MKRKGFRWLVLIALGVMAELHAPAFASEASTHFSIFVPPNNDNNGRYSALTVTAHANGSSVTVTDTDEDGDSDDSVSATLDKGQSIVVRIREGAVNDGAGGKWDGDRFIIDSDLPVTAMLSTRSEWQHDWVPAEGNTMRGQEFFVWAPRPDWEIDVVAYEDSTSVEIYEISTVAQEGSGITTVALPGELVLRQSLDEGEDLLVSRNRAGTNITKAGHTYRVITSRPATVMYGSFYQRERDGGGYVPSENGTTVGTHFYFPVPAGKWTGHEREIRIVAGDQPANVVLRAWDADFGWMQVASESVPAYGHLDYTGRSHALLKDHELFEVESDQPVNVFEANWLETGRVGTSDVFTYVSALDSMGASDVGQEFVAYVGPPGHETRAVGVEGSFSHLYIAGLVPNTTVTVTDVDTGGSLFQEQLTIANADDIVDVRITEAQYNALNNVDGGIRPYLRVQADQPVSVGVSNWNDNWLAFASGVQPASLSISISHASDIECNTSTSFQVTVTNDGDVAVQNTVLDVTTIAGLTLSNQPSPIGNLAAGASNVQTIVGSIGCGDISTGELVGIAATARGTLEGTTTEVAAAKTATAPALVPGVVGIVDVIGFGDLCAIELTWTTDEDDGGVVYEVMRREFDVGGAYAVVGQVDSLAPAQTGFVYGFRDINVTQGTEYQYMVRAVAASDGSEIAIAGPSIVLPGLPFTDIPGSTGDILSDYASSGITLDDPTGDMSSALGVPSGYDVDRIALAYDPFNDSLYLAVSAVGVFGDGDNDGDPDTNSNGAAQGLVDRANFSVDEQFAFVLDFDGTGEGDAIVGVPFGADIDFLQATRMNDEIGLSSPLLAFETPTSEEASELVVQILNMPSASAPDLEIVVYNISVLNGGQLLENIGFTFYLAGQSITGDVERAPSASLTTVAAGESVTPGCGIPAQEIHLGMFAVFGNIFTGAPSFDFVPMGWTDTNGGQVLVAPPDPVSGTVTTSPTVFLGEKHVDLQGTLSSSALSLSVQDVQVRDDGQIEGDNYKHTTRIDWAFSKAEGDFRYDNIDLQTFRLLVLDCSATAIVTQYGTSGVLRDDRFIRLADDSVQSLGDKNPALILSHSGFGTFETGGTSREIEFGTPDQWVSEFGPAVASEFTRYAFLDEVTYVGGGNPPEEDEVFPLSKEGFELQPGIWFINHYLWSYANEGTTRIETLFIPGPDCGGSL